MTLHLFTKEEAARNIAIMGSGGIGLNLFVREDISFGSDQLDVGTITLYQTTKSSSNMGDIPYDLYCAVQFGGFEWSVPEKTILDNKISNILKTLKAEDAIESVQKAFHEGLQDVVRRTLLLSPVFDADTMRQLPLRRPTTIVPDTSAVHQGALDFTCRFLTPHARIKIPAIVHMEIDEEADNYLYKIRFNKKDREKSSARKLALRQHLKSQGGQRTLLRIELHSDVEMERGDLGADPLRGIVQPSSDPEDKALGLSHVIHSFADRLIIETARRFQSQVRPDHPLALLTSDQGMARKAMTEGLNVFFFQARSSPSVEGRILTGTLFQPFYSHIYTIALTDVLWELAVSFGGICISNPMNGATLELWGIGGPEEVTWQPLYAQEDLLWGRFDSGDTANKPVQVVPVTPEQPVQTAPEQPVQAAPEQPVQVTLEQKRLDPPLRHNLSGSYGFSPDRMFTLISSLVSKRRLTREDAQRVIGVELMERYERYERFLRSGQLVRVDEKHVETTESLDSLWQALLGRDMKLAARYFSMIPSFKGLHEYVHQHRIVTEDDSQLPISATARSPYINLGEALGIWLSIPNVGIVITDRDPTVIEFARMALDTYEVVRENGETDWILTGQWLEELARLHSTHPFLSKQRLADALDGKSLRVYMEGSTPDTRFEKHYTWSIFVEDGIVQMKKIFLYHGDFIMPGTAAVRIKVHGVGDAA